MAMSLVTYTYNDHDFATALLRSPGVAGGFDEMIVVDDGSVAPFPESAGARVLRQAGNSGPGQAKRAGINAARGDIILSVDSDIRMDARWLRDALPLLLEPGVGLVGATILPALGKSYLSRALHRTADRRRENRATIFLTGGLWLFRRAIWERCGGLEDYSERTLEDAWFCRKLLQAGYILIAADRRPAYETRHLHRTAYCRRHSAYLSAPFLAAFRNNSAAALTVFDEDLQKALDYGIRSGELAFLYITILQVVVVVAEAARRNAQERQTDFPSMDAVLGGALHCFSADPDTAALLRDDLSALALPPPSERSGACPLLETAFAPVSGSGILSALEAEWPARLRLEDAELAFDAHYMSGSASL